jgi:hypothetical protein
MFMGLPPVGWVCRPGEEAICTFSLKERADQQSDIFPKTFDKGTVSKAFAVVAGGLLQIPLL